MDIITKDQTGVYFDRLTTGDYLCYAIKKNSNLAVVDLHNM